VRLSSVGGREAGGSFESFARRGARFQYTSICKTLSEDYLSPTHRLSTRTRLSKQRPAEGRLYLITNGPCRTSAPTWPRCTYTGSGGPANRVGGTAACSLQGQGGKYRGACTTAHGVQSVGGAGRYLRARRESRKGVKKRRYYRT